MSTDMIWQTNSTNSDDTERLGELLGKHLSGGEVLELRSDLGGGKTTFVRGLAAGAGSKDRVSSPTFTLSRIYKGPKFDVYHFDFYRLANPGLLRDQLAEAMQDNNVVVVEWGDIVKEVLPEDEISVELRPVAENADTRQITVQYPSSATRLIDMVKTEWQTSRP